MQETPQISEFGKIFVFFLLGILFVATGYLINKIISPHKPNPEKLTTYECGEEPAGNSWLQFNMRFYVVALIFLLFDVEIIFLFPWSTIFANKQLINAIPQWGWISLTEMFLFIGILLLGLVYVWRKGALEWIKPKIQVIPTNSAVPFQLYEKINQQLYIVKPFVLETKQTEKAHNDMPASPPTIKRPPFKSAIKKNE